MSASDKTSVTYRLIVTRQNGSEILMVNCASLLTLPRTDVRTDCRIAEQLTAKLRAAWGVDAHCAFFPARTASDPREDAKTAILEVVRDEAPVPAGTVWFSRLSGQERIEPSDARVLRESIEELETSAHAGPFARLGWHQDLVGWTKENIAPLGLHLSGKSRELNASASFSLIRFETQREAVWFKAAGAPNRHELPLTVLLAKRFPDRVPGVIAVHQAWNGWLSMEASGHSLSEESECFAWERAARSLAELQMASLGKTAEILEAGARNLQLSSLAAHIDPFFLRMEELMSAQEKQSPRPLDRSELSMLVKSLKDSCSLLEDLGIPSTLGHSDLNPGNIVVSAKRCVFLDWAETCVANPLLTFEYLRQHSLRSGIETPAMSERLTTAYLGPWTSLYSPHYLRRALALAPLVAVFAYALANGVWCSVSAHSQPALAAYFRSLTRRMFRESIVAAERSEPCLT